MCRNITTLRGLEPPASAQEIEAAARQYVRKVSAVVSGPLLQSDPFVEAVAAITAITTTLLATLPPRRNPPVTLPPGRRRASAPRA